MKSIKHFFTFLLVVCFVLLLTFETTAASVIKVASVTGKVTYKDRDSKQEIPVQVGQIVRRGGRLYRKEPSAQVSLICEDDQKRLLASRNSKSILEICLAPPNPRLNPEQFLEGGYDPLIPYIISPRYTRITTLRPTLKWNSVQGINEYEITICEIKAGKYASCFKPVKHSASKQKIEIREYPFEKNLSIGKEYKLVVKATQDISSDQEEKNLQMRRGDIRRYYAPESVGGGLSGLNFKVLEEGTRKGVLDPKLESIRQWQEPNNIKEFGIVLAYENNYLYSEAIEKLEHLLKRTSSDPFMHTKLGDLYAKQGLNSLAEKSFEEAIKQSKKSQNEIAMQEAEQSLSKLMKIRSGRSQA